MAISTVSSKKVVLIISLSILTACSFIVKKKSEERQIEESIVFKSKVQTNSINLIDSTGTTIESRFMVPENCQRITKEENSFARYLQSLPLKPHGSLVHYFNGDTKENLDVYCGVVNMEIGKRDLQQCADAVMRLRGEYLFHQNRKDEIGFAFLSDGKKRMFADFSTKRDYSTFRKYMDYVFAYANTRSLKNQLKPRLYQDMEIGDVFIQSGNPYGHCVIVVDMAQDTISGNKYFMLAQSYMPAQETQILVNDIKESISPWYLLSNEDDEIYTPEWFFNKTDLRHF